MTGADTEGLCRSRQPGAFGGPEHERRQTMGIIPEGWITTEEAAELAEYTAYYIRKLAQEGKIEAEKVGRDWLVNRESLLEYKANVRPGRPRETE